MNRKLCIHRTEEKWRKNMLQTLINIYNTLSLVETKGQSSIYMGASLSTLRELIEEEQAKEKLNEDTEKATL